MGYLWVGGWDRAVTSASAVSIENTADTFGHELKKDFLKTDRDPSAVSSSWLRVRCLGNPESPGKSHENGRSARFRSVRELRATPAAPSSVPAVATSNGSSPTWPSSNITSRDQKTTQNGKGSQFIFGN